MVQQANQFQSAPGGEAGGNVASSPSQAGTRKEFQSAPGGEAGGNPRPRPRPGPERSFNPPPAVRPGETGWCPWPLDRAVFVSIRPRR